MTSPPNSPGVRCYQPSGLDRNGYNAMNGFTDVCFPSQWLNVVLPDGQPIIWRPFEDPGVIVPHDNDLDLTQIWEGNAITTFGITGTSASFEVLFDVDPKRHCQLKVIINNISVLFPGFDWRDEYTVDLIDQPKTTPIIIST